jgi:hypothetical protein
MKKSTYLMLAVTVLVVLFADYCSCTNLLLSLKYSA